MVMLTFHFLFLLLRQQYFLTFIKSIAVISSLISFNNTKLMRLWSFFTLVMLMVFTLSCQKDDTAKPELDYLLNQNIYLPNENGDSTFIADPHVIKVGDTWYLYGTGYSSAGLAAWSTKDLINWKFEGLAWKPTPGTWNTSDLWAPDVLQGDDGLFYMYYSAAKRVGVAVSSSPTGPFTEVYDHPFIGGGYGGVGDGIYLFPDVEDLDFDEYAIDAHVYKASDGTLTMYVSVLTPFSTIAAIPMSDYVTLADETPKIVLQPDVISWENVNREAPFIWELNGVFHLMYSGAIWATNDYAVGVATGPTPMGPFTRRADNPILRKSPKLNLAGPGHHSVVEGKYNDLLIFYHTRDWGATPPEGRKTRYMQMYFDLNGQIQVNKVRPER
jgi:beta-xylosidase